jgi:heat shock protein HtpX
MDRDTLFRHQAVNFLQSALMLAGMAALLGAIGWLLGGAEIVVGIIVAGVVVFLMGPRVSPRLILRLYAAQRLDHRSAPGLQRLLMDLSVRANLNRAPDLYYVPSQVINAFTVGGRNDAAIAITDGMLRELNARELAGVLAHELSHVRHNDTRVMGLADLVARFTHFLSLFGQLLILINLPLILLTDATVPWTAVLLLVFAPNIAALLQLALSRTREFRADLGAVDITGDPEGLASALSKLEYQQQGLLQRLFLPQRQQAEPSLLRTHPGTHERVRRLLALRPEPRRPNSWSSASNDLDFIPTHVSGVRRPPRHRITGLWH